MTTQQGNHNYTYDNIYQLTQVVKPGPIQKTYNFDAVGNRTTVVNGGTQTYTANNLNQYTQIIFGLTTNLTYDLNGNLTQKTDGVNTTNYTYDYENRLVSVIPAQAGIQSVYFKYDPSGRRTQKEVNGVLQSKYIYGPGIDEPLAMIKQGNVYYYSKDGLGSVVNLTDSQGTVVESYTYDEYGNLTSAPSQIGNRYLYTSREYDSEIGLYYYRARYYDPTIGRFLQKDPVKGIIEIPETQHPYTYAINDPVLLKDPNGEAVPLIAVVVGAGALVGGVFEGAQSFASGDRGAEIAKAFGRGAVAGGLATAAGIGAAAVSRGNPYFTGAVSGAVYDAIRQALEGEYFDISSLTFSAVVGSALGPIASDFPGLKLKGRPPNMFVPRSLGQFGPNSLRKIGQEAVGGTLGGAIDSGYKSFK